MKYRYGNRTYVFPNKFPRPSFIAFMNKVGQDATVSCVEIGVNEGDNAIKMMNFMKNSKFVLVDPYIANAECGPKVLEDKKVFVKRIVPYNHRINIVLKTSEDAVSSFSDETFDYIYVDGSHQYHNVKKDLELWWPKLKNGGIMGGHDFYIIDIERATKEFVRPRGLILWGVVADLEGVQNKLLPGDYAESYLDWWIHKECYVVQK